MLIAYFVTAVGAKHPQYTATPLLKTLYIQKVTWDFYKGPMACAIGYRKVAPTVLHCWLAR